MKNFFERKDIEVSAERYFNEALSAMALGLFASLLIGLIFKTAGEQLAIFAGANQFSEFLIKIGATAMGLMGAGVGVAVAWSLKAPPLVMFSCTVVGMMGAELGGPAATFVAVAIASEAGKAISKETKVDIILTPAVTLLAGMIAAKIFGPAVGALMSGFGRVIMKATELQPFFMGIVVAVLVGLALTAPISSAALCIMLELSGLAAGAATVGCCAQMIGFAVAGYPENGIGGFMAQGLGTSMIQLPNIIKNPWVLVPPTLTGAILGPVSTVVFKMRNIPEGAGMGTSGLVGQIGTLTAMGFTWDVAARMILLHIIAPAVIVIFISLLLRGIGLISEEDYKLNL